MRYGRKAGKIACTPVTICHAHQEGDVAQRFMAANDPSDSLPIDNQSQVSWRPVY